MKLRVVASSKDLMIFVFFAIFLLYIVALGVLNLPQLAAEGTFYGLNPFEAFSPDYIMFTLVFYFLALGGLFFSVSSYFFEWENGIGFGLNSNNSNGYSSWAKANDIKKDNNIQRVVASDPTSEYAGIPLISNGKELWVDNGEYHNLVIGATGSGKTVSTILPTVKILAKKGESIICTDPKGEIYEKTGGLLKQKGYNIILLNFRNPQNGNAWNPLALPYKLYKSGNQDKAIELLDDLALNILYEENSGNSDPFWEKTAADYFAGIALAMFEDTTEDKININSINMTATVGEDKFGGSTYIKEYFNSKDPSSAAYVNASGTVMAPSETKGGIISVFKQKVKLFASRENLSEMLSYSDFELDSIGKKPTAVFVIIQDEKKTYHSLATIFIKQVYETLIDVAQASGGKLPCRTNFLLDEFANMPPLKDVTTMITAARSRQIRFTMIIQNFAQLNKVYGKDDAETIKGNCGNIIYLISTELAALEEISKLCGEKKSKKDDKTASTPLVTVSDLQRMKQFDEIVLRMRKNPFKTSFVPDFKIDWGNCVSPKVDYPTREKKQVEIFDIREFVKEKKNQKINEMMASMGSAGTNSSSPLGGTTNPFMSQLEKKNNSSNPSQQLSVNDLVKKIDQKLAEIEKEEQEQKRKRMEQSTKIVSKVTEPNIKPNTSKLISNTEDKIKKDLDSSYPINKPYLEKNIEILDDITNEEKNSNITKNIDYSNFTKEIENKVNKKINEKTLKNIDIERKQELKSNETIEKLTKNIENKVNEKIEYTTSNNINKIKKQERLINDIISNDFVKNIENKVNKKINAEIFDEGINEFDLLAPIEKNNNKSKMTNQLEDEKIFELLENEIKKYDDTKIKDPIIKEHKTDKVININGNHDISNNNNSNISKQSFYTPTTTIKLEDVSEDDKFFDDFFED